MSNKLLVPTLWAFMLLADAGFMQANLIEFRHRLAEKHPTVADTHEEATRHRRQDASISVAIAATGPIGLVVTPIVTAFYQDGWVDPFSREFWVP